LQPKPAGGARGDPRVSDNTVERTQSATRIFRQIQALARSDYGGNTNALLIAYAVEGFLRRLAASQ
jgi:hypothetical protein